MTTTTPTSLWDDVLTQVRARHPALVRGWFTDLALEGITHGVMTIRAANSAQQHYLEQQAGAAFVQAAQAVTGRLVAVVFHAPSIHASALNHEPRVTGPEEATRLNADFTLDNFVVGPDNRLAHAAAVSVANAPAQTYNPLFLHGPPGVGKTHLLHGLAQQLRARHPDARMICVPCAVYVNHLMAALEENGPQPFHARWRHVDVLMIDDVDFLAGRQRSQEDFFHLFNALHDQGKQIVLTAQRPPAEIADLPARLISRFSGGLVTLMEPACFETRLAIVRKKSAQRAIVLPEEVISFVAECLHTARWSLDEILAHLDLAAQRQSGHIDLPLARNVLPVSPGS